MVSCQLWPWLSQDLVWGLLGSVYVQRICSLYTWIVFCQVWDKCSSFLQSWVELVASHPIMSNLSLLMCEYVISNPMITFKQSEHSVESFLNTSLAILVQMVASATWICPKGCWMLWVDYLPNQRLCASSLRSHPLVFCIWTWLTLVKYHQFSLNTTGFFHWFVQVLWV